MIDALKKTVVLPISAQEQIYVQLKTLVYSDRCTIGQKLPTAKELAAHFSVSPMTAHAAMRMLAKEGLITFEGRRGTYVRQTLAPSEVSEGGPDTVPTIGVLTGTTSEGSDVQFPSGNSESAFLCGIQEELQSHGYAMCSIPFEYRKEPLSIAKKRISELANALSGLISLVMFPFDSENDSQSNLTEFLDQRGMPWVTVNNCHLSTGNYVISDHYGSAVEVGKLFGRLGRDRVLFLRNKVPAYSASQRESGLRDGLNACGVSPSNVGICWSASHTAEHGREAITQYLQQTRQLPNAIFATGDWLALAAIKVCQEHGLRVPEDVAVVGGTGLDAGKYSTPTLTTIRVPLIDMGKEAVRMLLPLIQKKEKQVAGKILPAPLVLRGSTPPLPVESKQVRAISVTDTVSLQKQN